MADVNTQLKNKNITTDIKVDTSSNVSSSFLFSCIFFYVSLFSCLHCPYLVIVSVLMSETKCWISIFLLVTLYLVICLSSSCAHCMYCYCTLSLWQLNWKIVELKLLVFMLVRPCIEMCLVLTFIYGELKDAQAILLINCCNLWSQSDWNDHCGW